MNPLRQQIAFLLLTAFSVLPLSAGEYYEKRHEARDPQLMIEWARPLKKNLVQVNRREQGGIAAFRDGILVTTHSGDMHYVSSKGEIKLTATFDGTFSIVPLVINEKHVIVSVSNKVYMLELVEESKRLDWKVLWHVSGKSSVASVPFVRDDKTVYIQFHDNSIYLVNKADGTLITSYSDFEKNDDVSVLRLPSPLVLDDKIVFGFSNGTIIFFMQRAGSFREELIPYYKFKTSNSVARFEKKEFYDTLSIVPIEDSILFSNGEYGGAIVDGKPTKYENMEDLQLLSVPTGIIGYGKRGVMQFDAEGKFVKQLFKSTNYVTNLAITESFAVVTTSGEGPMLGNSDGFIYLYAPDFSRMYHSIMVSNGISGKMAAVGNTIYLLSDKGVLYKFNILK